MPKELFILGAGFSRAITPVMPVLNGLTREIKRKMDALPDSDLKKFWNDLIITPNIGDINGKNANFEDIMTFLSSKFVYEDYKESGLKAILYQKVVELIRRIFIEKHIEKEIEIGRKEWKQFVDYLTKTKAHVFSFNYDLVFENLLRVYHEERPSSSDFDLLYSIPTQNHGGYIDAYELEDHLIIYKLHGSINWFYNKNSYGIQVENPLSPKAHFLGLTPLIVPPTILKNFDNTTNMLDTQWHQFKMDLESAERVYIIGYSIPKTDIATRFLLQTHLKKSASVHIISCNPSSSQREDWITLFNPTKYPGKALFKAKEEKVSIFERGFAEYCQEHPWEYKF